MASGLDNPWSLVFVGNQPVFTERDTKTISTIVNGQVLPVLTIPTILAEAEGGLLGLAYSTRVPGKLFVYYTTTSDNRVVSYNISGSGSGLQLASPQVLVSGIPSARSHNGGRIAIGPDGMLYIGTGDAGDPSRSQNPDSLAGKILRVDPATGGAAPGNPFGTPVYSLGHRNVQGLTWADDGTMFASELGQNDWDELNIIEPGNNYGWPTVEGMGNTPGFTDPVAVWTPAEASPSGLLWKDQNLYLAALRGQRLWVMLDHDPAGTDTPTLQNDPGRLRDVVAAPDGTIWVLTSNNTDDRIIRYELVPA
ncbi:PQQ-dependent sugar dehydrogenase [Tessaracoccus sp. OS52]|uniref:PQQ-dependent sugar dehydrogenase n=1 Tax=Tessaracoccus sp. OS52 TaxID=2886691 RepID=UPI001D12754E|nr:PQQ-dependent sugar dehydrogenase [Tessaracoccus sp. OS52]MCC2593415.1 PQQ-dependent sugar dehydrogenase [Tessaracoccus sp. OS52]